MGWMDAPEVKASPAWASAPEVGAVPASQGPAAAFVTGLKSSLPAVVGAGLYRGFRDVTDTALGAGASMADKLGGSGVRAVADTASQQGRAEYDQAYGKSQLAGVSRVGGNVLATLPVGGAIASGLGAIPGVAARIPNMLNAIRTSGMVAGAPEAGNALAQLGNLGTRAVGGGITGAAAGAAVDPNNAGTGAIIGGALPVATKAAGLAGHWLGDKIAPAVANPQRMAAAKEAIDAGFVIPPSDIKPQGAVMEALGGLSGKIKTAQTASAKNQDVTNSLAKKALGIADDAPINREVLSDIRAQAGRAYEAVSQAGMIQPGTAYESAIDKIIAPFKTAAGGFPNAKPNPIIAELEGLKSQSFDAAAAVGKIKELREAADKAYLTRDKSAGKALKDAAGALEDAIDTHLQGIGQPAADMLAAFRDSRQLIAKTYSVEKGLNGQTGDVSAQALASQLKRGKPLSDDLLTVAKAGEAFPKATQALKEAPKQVSPLDWAVAAARGNVLELASLGIRPAVRAGLLSGPAQRAQIGAAGNPNALQRLLENSDLAQLGYRAAPVMASGR